MNCINISHPEYKILEESTNLHPEVLQAKISLWMTKNTTDRFPNAQELGISAETVNATLKIVDSLNKVQRNVFTADKLQGWLNDLQKQGVPSQQLDLFKETAKPGMTKNEIAAAIAATYSYTIEINTAKEKKMSENRELSTFEYNGYEYSVISGIYQKRNLTTRKIEDSDKQEYLKAKENSETREYPTQIYSNLTVPGGTNYTEQEIATPAITPSIKGHAQFATDKGIGWFRSDEQASFEEIDKYENKRIEKDTSEITPWDNESENYIRIATINGKETIIPGKMSKEDAEKWLATAKLKDFKVTEITKTRRILEVQSDLFQKGRKRIDLTSYDLKVGDTFETDKGLIEVSDILEGSQTINIKNLTTGTSQYLDRDTFITAYKNKIGKSPVSKNDFLQLLNKDNNWVNFFTKSIIQDSAKQGYEKVLFPSGNTASKVEGHTTLEQFKKQKEDRIKELENRLKELNSDEFFDKTYFIYEKGIYKKKSSYDNPLDSGRAFIKDVNSKEEAKEIAYALVKKDSKNEIKQLKQELERVEGPEGFGALKPIYNFYENTVANILKKQGYSPKLTTDKYGNTWNEVEIKEAQAKETILYQKENLNYYQEQAKEIYFDYVYNQNLDEVRDREEIAYINKALQQISRQIGDVDWHLRQGKSGNWYIAGYKNAPVTMENYYSPHANGMFRQKTSESTEAADKNLNEKLYAWAKTHGISVEAIDTLLEKFGDRYERGILGVADFANALIGLADNAKIDTLPEEIAHFAIELLKNDPSVVRALQTVDQTEKYAEVKEEYKDIYTEEEDFRKEALGKLLAQQIVQEYKNQNQDEKGFWAYLKAIKEKFVKWVKNTFNKETNARKDLENILKPLAISILNNEKLGVVEPSAVDSTILYQLDTDEEQEEEDVSDPIIENKKKFLEEAVFQLQARMKKLKAGLKSTAVISAIESELNKINQNIAKGEMDLAISAFVKLAESEIESITKTLLKARETGVLNAGIIKSSQDFLNMYENIFNKFVESMWDNNIPAEETEELRKLIHNIAIQIRDTKGLNANLLARVTRNTLESANIGPNGEKIDPDFDPDMVAKETSEDMGTWRLQVGNYKYAESKLIKAAHKIVFDSIQVVKRFANKKANDLLAAQQAMLKSGGKIEDLIENDTDGKLGHYFVQEYDMGRYYKAMAETKAEIAKALGFEDYSQIQVQFLSKKELDIRKDLWKLFFKTHTKEQTILSNTSRGVTKVTVTVPNDSYLSKKYQEMMQNPATKAYYDLLIQTKTDAVNKLPLAYRTQRLVYMVPPILKSTLDRLSEIRGGKSFMGAMTTLAQESLFINQDETQFGQLNPLNNKMVPIYFTGELDSTKDLSYDIARSVTLFAEMAENFLEKNKIAGELGSIQYALAERNYLNKKGQRKKGIESNEYKALEILLDTHVFGIERDSLATNPIPETRITKALGIAGKQFSWTKASQRFATFIRNNNLAFNIPTGLSNWLKGSGDSIIEDAIGLYTTTESKNWARGEFFSNLFQVVGEIGKPKQTNKMHLMLQQAGVVELEKMLYETTKNRAIRKIANRDLMYATFATGDYGIKGRIALAIYDNYRLYNDQFMTRANYYKMRAKESPNKTEKDFSKEWKELREKSLYNAHDVVDGNLVIKPEFEKYVTDAILNSAAGKIEHVTTYVDGTMSKTDKGKLSRSIAGDFLLMHRGWFIGMIDTRFKIEGTNMITEEEEIGTYRASAGFLYDAFYKTLIKDRAGLSAAFATWHTLSPAKKRGVAKTALDLLYLNIVALVASMANLAADDADDDDWSTQYLAYQMNRLLLEQGAAWSPAELVQMIDEPVVGARMIKDLLDISEAFSSKVYESGMYKGETHASKWWFRKQPFKNVYEMQFPELKNRFIKNLVDSKVYQWMSPEQVNSVANKGSFANWLIPRDLASDATTEDDNMKVIVDSLQDDTEEDNGFN